MLSLGQPISDDTLLEMIRQADMDGESGTAELGAKICWKLNLALVTTHKWSSTVYS